jgi:hypothetical protein
MQAADIAPLADAIYRDRVARARSEFIGDKLLAGELLFRHACEWTNSGIRGQHPDWSEDEVLAELKRRLTIQDQLERRHVR